MNYITAIVLTLLTVRTICEMQGDIGLVGLATSPFLQGRAPTYHELGKRATRPSTCLSELWAGYGPSHKHSWFIRLDLPGAKWERYCDSTILLETIRASCEPKGYKSIIGHGRALFRWRTCQWLFSLHYQEWSEDRQKWVEMDPPTQDHHQDLSCVVDALKCFEERGLRVPGECRMLSWLPSSLVLMRAFD